MPDPILRLHHFEPLSRSNGPGLRSVIWVQGCTLNCPGCFNPRTHASQSGQVVGISDLFERILAGAGQIEGITISGGEPLQQAPALLELLKRVKSETGLSTLVFTGFTWEEAARIPQIEELLDCIDVLLAGRYRSDLRIASGLRGSSNKTVHFLSARYNQSDLDQVPPAEVIIDPTGEIRFSGIEPLRE
ncbi:organic radical activating enzyme [Longilinea arvoryzae]|uniref:Anaerobic ribonucleoside-triphosphate reductase-activating protein n=1 Tax=Longilinea arvoryzae TaxID=360412 RepID=A0A0S7BIY6_9CHLR|nr:4Fe-4S single cluster domain-containing protein [Longilinea arvoryzae]GAP14547.1 organic radical activating enzyme [Longilinea arvoryzae]